MQLRLQEIQARLKLKKLQNARAQNKAAGGASSDAEGSDLSRPESAPLPNGGGARPQPPMAATRRRGEMLERPKPQNAVEVPASPVRKTQPPVQTSPSRITLGIDKGLRAKDVSLKRAPSLRRTQAGQDGQPGGLLRRAWTPGVADGAQQTSQPPPPPRPLSFSERLTFARTDEDSRQDRQDRIQKLRSSAFDVGREEMEAYKTAAVNLPDMPYQAPAYSRDEVMASAGHPEQGGGCLHRSNTASTVQFGSGMTGERFQPGLGQTSPLLPTLSLTAGSPEGPGPATRKKTTPPDQVSEKEASSIEPYSGFQLSKRIVPHKVLARTCTDKKTYLLKDLLKHVKAPDWSLPDVEADVVVFAIVATKSDPRDHKPVLDSSGKPKPGAADRGKYMVLTLVDLTWELELYLFNTGFDRFWKIATGTVVAILNPTIIPPPPGRADTGRFGLVINSDADAILEIGTARDLGYCASRRKDGRLCSAWINARRTQFCEFHTNEAIKRARASRIEVNMMDLGGIGEGRRKYIKSREVYLPRATPEQRAQDEQRAQQGQYDRATGSRYFMTGRAQSSAALMDREESGFLDRLEREDGLKRRLAEQERERGIARKLAQTGAGAGRDYMRLGAEGKIPASSGGGGGGRPSSSLASSQTAAGGGSFEEEPRKVNAQALGLAYSKGRDVPIHLSPVKRKRRGSAQSTFAPGGGGGSAGKTGGLGWGSSLKDKLARMKDGEKLRPAAEKAQEKSHGGGGEETNGSGSGSGGGDGGGGERRDKSPVRKKTRFVTDKGIREAGRESLGGAELLASRQQVVLDDNDDDDDDELVIIR